MQGTDMFSGTGGKKLLRSNYRRNFESAFVLNFSLGFVPPVPSFEFSSLAVFPVSWWGIELVLKSLRVHSK